VPACGGGGGGSGDDRSIADEAYTGIRIQAYLDAGSAEALVLGAYGGGEYGNIIPLAIGGDASEGVKAPYGLPTLFKKTAAMVKKEVGITPQSLLDPAEVCVNYPYGTVTDNLVESENSTTYTLKGDVTFSNCDTGEGVIFDGTMTLSMTLNPESGLLTKMSFIMDPILVIMDGTSYTVYGTASGNEYWANSGDLGLHLAINATLVDSSAKTFWLNNYNENDIDEGNGIRSVMSGRYYDHDYGYVDFTTVEAIFTPYNATDPTYEGLLEYTGRDGSHANLWLGVNQYDYCIKVFNSSGVVDIGTCAK
jgi:hypothetical protein